MKLKNGKLGTLIRKGINSILGRWRPSWRVGGLKLELWTVEDLLRVPNTLKTGEYQNVFGDLKIKSFLDIGCNYGGFLLWLFGNGLVDRKVIGMCIDASDEQVRKAMQFFFLNGLHFIPVIHGFVGGPHSRDKESFNESLSPSCSGKHLNPDFKYKPRVTEVPVLNIPNLLKEMDMEREFDVINIDIEGGEFDLLLNYDSYISRAKWIIIEWHEPYSTLSFIRWCLYETHDLYRVFMENSGDTTGTAYFKRRDL